MQNVDKDMEQLELLHFAHRNINGTITLKNESTVTYESKHTSTLSCNDFTPRYLLKKLKQMSTERLMQEYI